MKRLPLTLILLTFSFSIAAEVYTAPKYSLPPKVGDFKASDESWKSGSDSFRVSNDAGGERNVASEKSVKKDVKKSSRGPSSITPTSAPAEEKTLPYWQYKQYFIK